MVVSEVVVSDTMQRRFPIRQTRHDHLGHNGAMRLKIVQAGEPVLRQAARPLTAEEIRMPAMRELLTHMRETMRDAPGVGLAAPQVGTRDFPYIGPKYRRGDGQKEI